MSNYFSQLVGAFTEQPLTAYLALVGLVIFGFVLIVIKKQNFSARTLAIGAICVAISFVLSMITLYKMPQGGSITPASMLPIVMYGFAFGPAPGMIAGLAYGLLQIIQGAYIVHPVQFLFDYILPFTLLGASGFFRNKNLIAAIIVACFLRFLMHFTSGVVFWGEYAPEGMSPYLYSTIYNGSYMLPETIICIVVALIPGVKKAFLRAADNKIKIK